MTKLEQARKLLAEATPGAWIHRPGDYWIHDPTAPEYEGMIECHDSSLNAALIVAAVNQYSALLDVVEAAKAIHIKRDRDGKPVIIGMLPLSQAIAKWEET